MSIEHLDVLIVGAGLSGIGAACRLRERCPGKTFAILEARDAIGGTWDLFRFPGIRSDSDMYTLSYPFRPWAGGRTIVDGASIRSYVEDTARERGVDAAIRFGHRVVAADWSSDDQRWHVTAGRAGETVQLTCGFLFTCTGYYRYDRGYTPAFEGIERFRGEVVHPQRWPQDTDYAGKRVVVIGSGATAVTLIPALAEHASKVTMLQRSPSYVLSLPSVDPLARPLARVLPSRAASALLRWKNLLLALGIYLYSRRRPAAMRRLLRKQTARRLPPGFDVDTHFNPRYAPWDQRMCIIPDADLFEAIRGGRVDVVTDRIARFTERGIALESGAELEADLVVTATGLQMVPLGAIELSVDGREVALGEEVAYRGMQISNVPNLAFAFGYTNQSWTLGSDLTCRQVCRLLNYMDGHGYAVCTPRRDPDAGEGVPFADLTAGYVLRDIGRFPRQDAEEPWLRQQNYVRNAASMRRARFEDGALEFTRAAPVRVSAASV